MSCILSVYSQSLPCINYCKGKSAYNIQMYKTLHFVCMSKYTQFIYVYTCIYINKKLCTKCTMHNENYMLRKHIQCIKMSPCTLLLSLAGRHIRCCMARISLNLNICLFLLTTTETHEKSTVKSPVTILHDNLIFMVDEFLRLPMLCSLFFSLFFLKK